MTKKSTTNITSRNSRIELLKIISMFLIVYYHAARNGFLSTNQPPVVYFTSVVLGSWGLVGVDLFVIISSWFMYDKCFDVRRIINIIFQTITWIFGYMVFYIFYFYFVNSISILTSLRDFVLCLAMDFFQPFWMNYYWFVTSYLFMVLLSPFMNKLLKILSKEKVRLFLIITSFVIIIGQYNISIVCDIVNFCYIYMVVNYIQKYGLNCKKIKLVYAIVIALFIVFVQMLSYFVDRNYLVFFLEKTIGLYGRHSINVLLIAFIIFINTINKKKQSSKLINKLSSKTLGVYLFHENNFLNLPNTTNSILRYLDMKNFMCSGLLFSLRSIIIAPAIYLAGYIIESIRFFILQKPFMKIMKKYDNVFDLINNFINNF